MKPLTNGGVLVDKREQLIYEAYKNKPLANSESFKKEIRKNYGFIPSTELYKKIINYQVKNFGKTLDNCAGEYIKDFKQKRADLRRKRIERDISRQRVEISLSILFLFNKASAGSR